MCFVRKLVITAVAVAVCAAGPASASAPTLSAEAAGVRIAVPPGWRVTHGLSGCSEPHEILAIARSREELLIGNAARYRGGLILLLETRGTSFAPRSEFRLPAGPTRFEGCCDMPSGPGYQFTFSENGREFEAFVFTRKRAVATAAVAILNTLRVS
jgi:hypothetical protein